MNYIFKNAQFKFVIILGLTYLLLYYGLKYFIGLSVPGGSYSIIVDQYFNIANFTRNGIMYCVQNISTLFGYTTIRESNIILKIVGGGGIKLIYGCLGFGVMCFWVSFIVATKAKLISKAKWLIFGLSLLWVINIIRISLVLFSTVYMWKFPFGIDQHTWFNIVSYLFIFVMIYFFELQLKKQNGKS